MTSPSEFHYGRPCVVKATGRRVRIISISDDKGLVGVRSDTPGMKRTMYFLNELELCAYPIPVGATLIDMLQECATDYPELKHVLCSVAAEIISLREELNAAENTIEFTSPFASE